MIELRIRNKYIVGKVSGGPYKPATNQKRKVSLEEALYASWMKHEPGRSQHIEIKKQQTMLPKKIMVISVSGKTKFRWEDQNA